MENEKKKGIVGKIVGDMADHAKTQHEITKARHAVLTKTPKQAHEEFKERHEYAKKSPKEKQEIELAELKAKRKN